MSFRWLAGWAAWLLGWRAAKKSIFPLLASIMKIGFKLDNKSAAARKCKCYKSIKLIIELLDLGCAVSLRNVYSARLARLFVTNETRAKRRPQTRSAQVCLQRWRRFRPEKSACLRVKARAPEVAVEPLEARAR